MKRIYLFFSLIILLHIPSIVHAQCPSIVCPSDITVNNDSGACGAVVTYSAPVATDPCSSLGDTIYYTGGIVTWTVPAGVTSLTIEARGAEGSFNTSSSIAPGLGAIMIGDFIVNPGDQLKILVGQQYTSTGGNGGGGGTFVTDISNNPLIIAGGGGGSSGGTDSPDKHGQAGTTGGTGAAGGGTGGAGGNGGGIGPSGFQAGAGGGLLTNGADGWTAGSGGQAFIGGGAGANVGFGIGGFGGGGNGSGYVVGGGGGGYSGGGSGGNSSSGVGGGGGSFNGGTNQTNTGGINVGNGLVIINYASSGSLTTTLISGSGSGSTFPVGISTEVYVVDDGLGNTDTCSFTITVNDTESPVFTSCLSDVSSCDSIVNGIAPSATIDNCSASPTITYILSGATVGSGTGDVSGTEFNMGITTVQYIANDSAGNADTCTFNVTIHPVPNVTASSIDSVACITDASIPLSGAPAGGTWSGAGISGNIFSPSLAGVGTHVLIYSFTNVEGCSDSATTTIDVLGCAGFEETSHSIWANVYPNPTSGSIYITLGSNHENIEIAITELNGKKRRVENYINKKEMTLDIGDLSSGVYFLHIMADGHSEVMRIVKK